MCNLCHAVIAMICVTKSRTGNYDFRACARARGSPGSARFGRTYASPCVQSDHAITD